MTNFKTIRQIAGEKRNTDNMNAINAFWAAQKAGDTKTADKLMKALPANTQRSITEALSGTMSGKGAVNVEAQRAVFTAVKTNDIDGVVNLFGTIGAKLRKGVLASLVAKRVAGNVTPEMATAIDGLAA